MACGHGVASFESFVFSQAVAADSDAKTDSTHLCRATSFTSGNPLLSRVQLGG